VSSHVLSDLKGLTSRASQATDACIAVKADPITLQRLVSLSHPLF
jgi:hypothetical protein